MEVKRLKIVQLIFKVTQSRWRSHRSMRKIQFRTSAPW